MGNTQAAIRRVAKQNGFWTHKKSGKNKRRKWVQVAQCTDAEISAVMAICEQYSPDTLLQDIKTDLVKGAVRLLFDKIIDAGFTTAGDVQRSRNVY